MKIEKEECSRCEGKGCVDCTWSGKIYKNTAIEDALSRDGEKK